MVALARSLRGGFGGNRLFSGVSGVVRRRNKIAVVGVNGAGKSTLLKILAGQTEPTTGSYNLGANVEVGYFSQHALEVLDPRKTVFETIQDVMPLANIGVTAANFWR